MKRAIISLPLIIVVLAYSPALGQRLPVTTTSEEARQNFEVGRNLAFHWLGVQAHEYLDAAIAADSGFVLAYLHRAGTSPPHQRPQYFDLAEAHRGRVTEGEQRLIDAFRAFLLEDDHRGALEILRKLSEEYPDDPYIPGYMGMRYYNLKDYEAAARQFRIALERDSDFVQAYHLLGYAALNQDDFHAAEDYFNEYLRHASDLWRSYFALGRLYDHQGHPEEAAEHYERAARLDPSGEVHNRLGYTYMEAGRHEAAERTFREYIRLSPEDPNPYDSLGELYLSMARYEEAAAQFEQALARDPDFSSSRDNLIKARIGQANRRFEEAFGGHDAPVMAALYTKDGQLLPAGSGVVEGIEAIRRYWEGVFEAGFTSADLETLEVYVEADGEVATEVGRYRLTANDKEADAGKYIVVWQRTPEGWRLHRDIWTTDQAPGE